MRAAVFTILAIALSACGGQAHAAAPAEPVVRLVAHDHAFEVPANLPAGRVRLRFVNRGAEPHYARFLRLTEGKRLSDYLALPRAERGRAPWIVPAGGIAPISPGDSVDFVTEMPSGRYALLCGYPGHDGRPHVERGMIREVEVRAASAPAPTAAVRGSAPIRLELGDSAMRWSRPVSRGRQRIVIENRGRQRHQALIVRIPRGSTLAAERAWFDEGFRNPRPSHPHGGAIELLPGERVEVTIDFAPGRYGLLCHVVETGGRSHFAQGETQEFTVR